MNSIPPTLTPWLETHLATPFHVISRPASTERGQVFELRDAGGRRVALKQSSSADRFENERRALVEWAGRVSGLRVPEVIACDRESRAFLLEWIDGVAEPQTPNACELAGRALRALHDAEIEPPSADPVSVVDAIRARLDASLRVLDGDIASGEAAAWRALAERVGDSVELRRRPTHRDFVPRNWIQVGADLVVIDFEHARFDVPELEYGRLWRDLLRDKPDLEPAFDRGYGGPLHGGNPEVRQLSIGLDLLRTAAWFRNRFDDERVRAWLQALRDVGGGGARH